MTWRQLYPAGRASALCNPLKKAPLPSPDLIDHLRAVRESGDRAMTAVEQYDPDFSLKLSACTDEAAAERLLEDWLARRFAVLKRTQSDLRKVWRTAHSTGRPEGQAD